MGKPKKSKKKDFASDEDEPPRMIESNGGVQDNGGDEEEEEGFVEVVPQTVKGKKQSKKKAKKQLKSRFDVDSDDEDGEEEAELNGTSGEVHVMSQKATGFAALMGGDSDGDEEPVITSGRRQKNKGGFSALMMEESDEEVSQVGMSEDETSTAAEPSTAAKKKDKKKGKEKKKKKKAQGFDDDADLERMLSELSVEYTGDKPPQPTTQSAEEASVVKESPVEVAETVEQKPVAEDKEVAEVDEEEDDADDEGGTVKTKAQKRKEKKERDRLKKVTQKQKETKGDKPVKPEELSEKPAPAADEESQEATKEAASKKKKKKAAAQPKEEPVTVEEDGPKKKKGPGKKLVAAMQEALRQQQEAEERAEREEEEKILREEEADRMRKEALEREKEMKELKKKQAKERRDQLKSEGKLLTPKQKQNLARAQAMLDAMKQQGAQVGPSAQKARPSAKDIRKQRKKPPTDVSSDQARTIEDVAAEEKSVTVAKVLKEVKQEGDEKKAPDNGEVSESWDPDIKESWDQTSDAEEEPSVSTTTAEEEDKSTAVDASRGAKDAGSAGEEGSTSNEDEGESGSDEEEESSSSSDDDDERTEAEKRRDRVVERLDRRRKEARDRMSADCLRAPVICVLGHVDTGKTKILDKLRRTNVQEGEAGGITQQIGATNVPLKSIEEQQRLVKSHKVDKLKIPGLLIIDTPGHESFSNLRSRGSSLCDLAILVVDIMHGLEPQTIESINLLKTKRTPFVVALNKIDRLYDWETGKGRDVEDVIKAQERHTQIEFEKRSQEAMTQLAEQGLNAKLFYENDNPREYLSVVPTSAITGEGMANLMSLVVMLTQNMLTKRLMYSDELQATVLEVKQIPGLGTTVDVILVNGTLREGSTVVLAGTDGPIVTQIRSLLMPQPLKELRVKNAYQEFKEIRAAQGVKIAAKELEKAIAGLNLLVAEQPDEVEICRAVVNNELRSALRSIRLSDRGVLVQASTLGSLEALLEFLRTSKIAYSGVRIGPVVKRDVMKASTQLQHDAEFACILAFDVKVERDAQEMADNLSVTIFQADIIYHLFDRFVEYKEQLKQRRREQHKHVAVFPCKIRVLPQFVFNSRDPIVAGVSIEGGIVRVGTPVCVPSKEFLHVGFVASIEHNHKQVDSARKGAEVCIKIDPVPGESPKMFGRHFDETDILISRISRESIDACKNYFRDDLLKADWQLMIELKKMFQII